MMSRDGADTANALADIVVGAGLLAAGANVIMQLGRPGVGHGVLDSTVDSGNLFRHPWKRTRTTLTYLAVATLGTDDDRREYGRAVDHVHAAVHSDESSPVRYDAFDTYLQLWVAACLYKGFEDSYTALCGRELPHAQREAIYASAAPLGTTLQIPRSLWPTDVDAFDRYWHEALGRVALDPPVRRHLLAIVDLRFLPGALERLLARFHRFVTIGFLPQRFRDQMGLRWTARDQRRFDRLAVTIGAVALRAPRPVRQFPFNVLLRDARRRIRNGRPLL